MKEIHFKIDKTVEWLREKVKESNTNGLVVGISGGIDSAVVAY
ncbi:NAD(+) synthetase, partial [Paeniclostridium sordellii]|nr:NAD(+) synthetase [Paeniclostridium sordellii]